VQIEEEFTPEIDPAGATVLPPQYVTTACWHGKGVKTTKHTHIVSLLYYIHIYTHTHTHTHIYMTSLNRVLEKLTVPQLVKKFPAFY
jgi:hypothetical protein